MHAIHARFASVKKAVEICHVRTGFVIEPHAVAEADRLEETEINGEIVVIIIYCWNRLHNAVIQIILSRFSVVRQGHDAAANPAIDGIFRSRIIQAVVILINA